MTAMVPYLSAEEMKPPGWQAAQQEIRSSQEVAAKDGVRISFDLYSRPGRRAVVIICPGFLQSKETEVFRRLARDLAREQDVICMDFRGHGRSGGLYTFSAREGADLEAVLEWAKKRYPRIVLMGFSLGAAAAINTAARLPARQGRSRGSVEGLIAVSAPSSFEEIECRVWRPDAFKKGLQNWQLMFGCRPGFPWWKKGKPIDAVAGLSRVPKLFIHGTDDWVISHRHSERLHRRAAGAKRLELIEKGGHAEELYEQDPERFLGLVRGWLETVLNPAGPFQIPEKSDRA